MLLKFTKNVEVLKCWWIICPSRREPSYFSM